MVVFAVISVSHKRLIVVVFVECVGGVWKVFVVTYNFPRARQTVAVVRKQ